MSSSFEPQTVRFWNIVIILAACLTLTACLPNFSSTPSPSQPAEISTDQGQEETNAWIRTLTGLSPTEQGVRAESVWRDTSRSDTLRARAAFILSTRPGSNSLAAQQYLSGLYLNASQAQRVEMERMLTADLLTADADTLRNLGGSVPQVQESIFPWSLTVWHAAQRNLLTDSPGALARLSNPAYYADPTLVGLSSRSVTPLPGDSGPTGMYSGVTALVLPLGGPYGGIGKQVVNGAQVAQDVLAAQGVNLDVRIIDSDQPGWQGEFARLPQECVVVGGPLRAEIYSQLKAAHLLSGKALFNFLSMLPDPGEEGSVSWRFFTSPQDQIDAVLDFTIGSLGIRSYGVFAPQDDYGRRMTDMFLQIGGMRGISVSTDTYSSDMGSWTTATGNFLGAVATERGQIPRARASFDAIFLPDGWRSMDMLISSLNYHGAHKKVMIGTSIWESALVQARGLNTQTYGLTVFPGAWNAQSSSPSALNLVRGVLERGGQANDWSALGYDFVQFAAALGLNTPLNSPAELNARLGGGVHVEWAGAPMTWDSYGKGHRRLFLFQPSRNGMVPLDPEAFIAYMSGTGPLPNAERGEAVPASRYDPEMLEPDLDALVESIVGQGTVAAPVTAPPPAQAGPVETDPVPSSL